MPAPTDEHLAALAADENHAYQTALAKALANPATVWVWEEHYVGNETSPSARLFRTRDAALRTMAEEEAAARAEDEAMGEDHTPTWEADDAYGCWDGGTGWRNDDGDWRTLSPQVPTE